MFSGKTSRLINELQKLEAHGETPVLIKHSADLRFNSDKKNLSITHDKKYYYAAIPATTLTDLKDHPEIKEAKYIGIDEGQFFEDISPVCSEWARNGKHLIIAALDGDYKQEMFPSIAKLLPQVDFCEKLSSECRLCGSPAPFSFRKTSETSLQVIGGDEKYMSLCRTCLHTQNALKRTN